MGTMCEEGFCDCEFHKPNMKHPSGCRCDGCKKPVVEKVSLHAVVGEVESLHESFRPSGIVEAKPQTLVTDFNDYQRCASVTSNKNLRDDIRLAVSALGVAGEAGEVADYVKKHLGHGHELDKDRLCKELGDVLWYVAELATLNNISLSVVAQKNIDKLAARYPEGFSTERSKNRKEGDT